jgi:hypothetical protein
MGRVDDMSEMVERVARAIIAGFDEITEPEERASVRKLARAAIEAMREPTEGMVNLLLRNMSENEDNPNISYDAIEVWRAMIDEALR